MGLFGSKTSQTDAPVVKKAKTTVKKPVDSVKPESTSTKDLYATEAVKTSSKTKVATKFSELSLLLLKPLVTEKATTLAADNKYVFVVAKTANKISIAKAIKALYGIKPLDINIVNMKGKSVVRGRIRGQRKDWKKAIVTVAKGETISIYEGV